MIFKKKQKTEETPVFREILESKVVAHREALRLRCQSLWDKIRQPVMHKMVYYAEMGHTGVDIDPEHYKGDLPDPEEPHRLWRDLDGPSLWIDTIVADPAFKGLTVKSRIRLEFTVEGWAPKAST